MYLKEDISLRKPFVPVAMRMVRYTSILCSAKTSALSPRMSFSTTGRNDCLILAGWVADGRLLSISTTDGAWTVARLATDILREPTVRPDARLRAPGRTATVPHRLHDGRDDVLHAIDTVDQPRDGSSRLRNRRGPKATGRKVLSLRPGFTRIANLLKTGWRSAGHSPELVP